MTHRTVLLALLATTIIAMPEGARTQGLEKRSEAKVVIGAGTYTTKETLYLQDNQSRTDSDAKFKGKGFMGGLIGKLFPSGKRTTLVDLDQGITREIDPKKKKCVMRDMTAAADTMKKAMSSLKDLSKSWNQERSQYQDRSASTWEVVESVFSVSDMNESKNLNKFECSHYAIQAYTVRRDTVTEAVMVDSMYVDTWVTAMSDQLKLARDIQQDYAMAMAEKMGLGDAFSSIQETFLGGKWVQMFKMTGGSDLASDGKYENMAAEMEKLSDKYPIKTEGRFFARVRTPGKKMEGEATAADEDGDTDMKSMSDVEDQAAKQVSGFAKSLFGKKKKEEPKIKPIFSFSNEEKVVKITSIDPDKFTSKYECKEAN